MTMLTNLFSNILELSLTALPVMAAVVLVRAVLVRRASHRAAYALWAVVGLRLLCPVSLPSPMSLFNWEAARQIQTAAASTAPVLREVDLRTVATALGPGRVGLPAGSEFHYADPAPFSMLDVLTVVWAIGVAALVVYGVVSYLRLRRRVSAAVILEGNVYECDGLETPFVLGFFHPRIFIPFRMDQEERNYVLLHERAHIRRRDHLVKPLAFLILAAYWFHPAVWLCWLGLNRDMELCCDEAVLRTQGAGVKTAYSRSLLGFATGRRFPAPSPLSFGEHDASARVKNVLRWKKAAPAVTFLAVTVCILVALVCGTDGMTGRAILGHLRMENTGQIQSGVAHSMNQTSQYAYEVSNHAARYSVYQETYEDGKLTARKTLFAGRFGADLPPAGTMEVSCFRETPSSPAVWRVNGETAEMAVPWDERDEEHLVMSASGTGDGLISLGPFDSVFFAINYSDNKMNFFDRLRPAAPAHITDENTLKDMVRSSDMVILLRLSVTTDEDAAKDAGWVRAENPSSESKAAIGAFTVSAPKEAASFVLYQEVYTNGEKTSYAMIMDDFDEGVTDRQFKLHITGEPNLQTGQVGWEIETGAARMTFPSQGHEMGEIPHVGASANVLNTHGEKRPLELDEDLILMVFGLTRQATSSHMTCEAIMDGSDGWADMLDTNDRVVLLRLRLSNKDYMTSAEEIEGAAEAEADTEALWALRTRYMGDAPAMGALVQALGVGELGDYSVEMQTSGKPLSYQINFSHRPADEDALDRAMGETACLLLALVENLEEVRWSYPASPPDEYGRTALKTGIRSLETAQNSVMLGQPQNLLLIGYSSLKDCADSPEDLQNLLNYLQMN